MWNYQGILEYRDSLLPALITQFWSCHLILIVSSGASEWLTCTILLLPWRPAHLILRAGFRLIGCGMINPRTMKACRAHRPRILGWALAQSVSSLEHLGKKMGLWVTQKTVPGVFQVIATSWACYLWLFDLKNFSLEMTFNQTVGANRPRVFLLLLSRLV